LGFCAVLVGSLANYFSFLPTYSHELTIRAAAEECRGKISEAKRAMLVQYLQNIRQGDLVVYER
jgi:hypothetical protein